MTPLGEYLKKWWLPAALLLLATTPSALVLFFQSSLVPHIKAQESITLLNIGTLLLWLVLLLVAFVVTQRPWLKWDSASSTWVSRFTNLRYCAKCRVGKKLSPLGIEDHGWSCSACNGFYDDPKDRPPLPPKKPCINPYAV